MFVRKLFVLAALGTVACSANVEQEPTASEAPVAASAEARVQEKLKGFEAKRPAFDAALVAAGLDPNAAEREANAISAIPDPKARVAAAQAWRDKYGSYVDSIFGKADEAVAADDEGKISNAETLRGDVNSNPYTSCSAGPTDVAPWSRASPNNLFEIRNSGLVYVLETGGFADGETSESSVDGALFVSPAEGELTVTGTVNIDDGWVEVWSTPPFGYANAGIGLRITVKGPDGAVLCTHDRTLTEYSVWGSGHVPSGAQSVSCNFMKDQDIQSLSVRVALRAWNAAGGAAGAHAQAGGHVTSITSRVCTEPGILINGQGYCVEPAGSSTSSGLASRVSECDGGANQRWAFDPLGRIASRQVFGLCLQPFLGRAVSGSLLTLGACDPSASTSNLQRFTRSANGQLRMVAHPELCVDGAIGVTGSSSLLQLKDCALSPNDAQRFTFNRSI